MQNVWLGALDGALSRGWNTHLPRGAKFPNEHIQTHMSESLACTEIAPFNVVMRIRNRRFVENLEKAVGPTVGGRFVLSLGWSIWCSRINVRDCSGAFMGLHQAHS